MHGRSSSLNLGVIVATIGLTLAGFTAGCTSAPTVSEAHTVTEILWDRYGVPHIIAPDAPAAFYGLAWAQMHAHGSLLLRLYGVARGRGAEYWGEEYLESDKWVRTMGVPERAARWYERQRPAYKACLDAFVEGINEYAARHRDRLDPAVLGLLPVSGADVLGHVQHVILFNFLAQPPRGDRSVQSWTAGSNAWAIGPDRSASRHPILVANPHLPWSGATLWFEAQIITPEVNASGVALVGQPVLGIAFNDHLGWTHTVNTMDGADLYELTLVGDSYSWDGGLRRLDVERQTLKVRQRNGEVTEMPFTIKRSIHGPIVTERPGHALALRVVGLEQAYAGEQYWDMLRARSLAEFQTAVSRLEQPFFTTIYADRDGHIMHFFGGRTPVRPLGPYDWSGVVRGDTPRSLWTMTHAFEDLPRIVDPPSGWLQNANDPPWTTTFPRAVSADNYPSYMAPRYMRFRAQRSARMLEEDPSFTIDEVVTNVLSTRLELADRLLDDLLPLAHRRGGAAAEAAAILERWDRAADAGSRGAVLFEAWFDELSRDADLSRERMGMADLFAVKWDQQRPLTTPDGLADRDAAVAALERAFGRVRAAHGSADVPWGDVYRLRRDDLDLPASGGADALGSFNVLGFRENADGKFSAVMGTSYVAIVEFGRSVRAQALLTTGNASQPSSVHRSDQIALYAAKRLRPVWRARAEIEANLERRETLAPSRSPETSEP